MKTRAVIYVAALLLCKEGQIMLKKLKLKDFDEVFSIMKQSFPADERRLKEEQKALFENEEYCIYTAGNEKTEGFMAVWDFDEFLFLEHFAVDEKSRNNGLGKAMLSALLQLSEKTVCLEVEPPDAELPKRRVAFYERNGFFLNDYPYVQPPISSGKKAVPLMIMTSERKICKEEFTKIKKTLYNKVYKCEVDKYDVKKDW